MNLHIKTMVSDETGIYGECYTEDGEHVCSTLEHAYPDGKGGWTRKVAVGTYKCVRHPPNRLPYETFMLEDVPDFQGKPVAGILIHRGNFDKDSEGCILVGAEPGEHSILRSAAAFSAFMALQEGLQEFTLILS